MTHTAIIGLGAMELAEQLEALGLETIRTRREFRIFASALADPDLNTRLNEIIEAHMQRGGAPAFGGDRPYLKKKKGRS